MESCPTEGIRSTVNGTYLFLHQTASHMACTIEITNWASNLFFCFYSESNCWKSAIRQGLRFPTPFIQLCLCDQQNDVCHSGPIKVGSLLFCSDCGDHMLMMEEHIMEGMHVIKVWFALIIDSWEFTSKCLEFPK